MIMHLSEIGVGRGSPNLCTYLGPGTREGLAGD